jgi:Protein of unknown function, DUF547
MKLLIIPAAFAFAVPTARAFDHTHAALTKVLAVRVKDGAVDYRALKASPNKLGAYLATLAEVRESEFNGWTQSQQLAFLINLYNAQTVKLIIDNYPVDSIKSIGGFFGPFKQKVVHVWGGLKSLNDLENGILRRNYREPRIHFALVCAAKSCPPLRAEAYQAENLDVQLDDQARIFLAQRAKNRVDSAGRTLYLSPIFDWYSKDFKAKAKSVEAYIRPFLSDKDAAAVKAGGFTTKFTDYDWSLNAQ